jgi:ATP-dependent RNA helicase SUPV3L1/SUV3
VQNRKKRRRSRSDQRKARRKKFAKTPENERLRQAAEQAVWPSAEEAAAAAEDLMRKKLVSQRLYTRKHHHDEEITPQIEFDLRKWTEGGRTPIAYFHFKHSRTLMKKLTRGFREKNPELAGAVRFVSAKGHWVNIAEWVEKRLHKIAERGEKAAAEKLSFADIMALIEQNGHYPFVKNRSRERELIRKQIPEHIAELFPVARSVDRHFILHVGPTNSGKTHEAIQACEQAEAGVYLAPLRLLAMEQAERMNQDGVPCSMVTGEEERLIEGASHMASTIEMMSEERLYDVAVIDECQMIADRDRGWAWTQAVLGIAAKTVHVCMAPEALNLVTALIEECGDTWETVKHHRATPLTVEDAGFVFPDDVRSGDALVVFSRKSVLQAASILEDKGRRVSVIYGALPYDARRAETKKFLTGETDVVVATDAIGMGMNLPIKRIIFLETDKFDGVRRRDLTPPEIKQIAGRAGRRGFAEKGLVNASFNKSLIAAGLDAETVPLEKARVSMPRFLVNMESPLSQTIQDWQALPDEGLYLKTDMARAFHLCVWLEVNCTLTKPDMLRAITIPFDENDLNMWALWRRAMKNYDAGRPVLEHVPRTAYEPGDGLERLEKKYRTLDLMYYLQRSLGENESYAFEEKQDILGCKAEVAGAIVRRLKKAKRVYRRCRICGTKLPWNDPYTICDKCYQALHGAQV